MITLKLCTVIWNSHLAGRAFSSFPGKDNWHQTGHTVCKASGKPSLRWSWRFRGRHSWDVHMSKAGERSLFLAPGAPANHRCLPENSKLLWNGPIQPGLCIQLQSATVCKLPLEMQPPVFEATVTPGWRDSADKIPSSQACPSWKGIHFPWRQWISVCTLTLSYRNGDSVGSRH